MSILRIWDESLLGSGRIFMITIMVWLSKRKFATRELDTAVLHLIFI